MAKRKRRTQDKKPDNTLIPRNARISAPPDPRRHAQQMVFGREIEIDPMNAGIMSRMPTGGKAAVDALKRLQAEFGAEGKEGLEMIRQMLGLTDMKMPNMMRSSPTAAHLQPGASEEGMAFLQPRTPEQYVGVAHGLDSRTARHMSGGRGIAKLAGTDKHLFQPDDMRGWVDRALAGKGDTPPAPNFLDEIIQALSNFYTGSLK